MEKKFVLGVDGGNTKTQYYLFDLDGNCIDEFMTGTCSHEKMADGFEGCKSEMKKQLNVILSKNNVEPDDLLFSVFGLAGADFEWQKESLRDVLSSLGFENFIVENDGYIALKAGSPDGTGICSVNGTGTVTVGVKHDKRRLQLGGIGSISGDNGGGAYLAECAAAAVYNSLFRCEKDTVLSEMILSEFGIKDKKDYAYQIIKAIHSNDNILKINLMLKEAERLGDAAAIEILKSVGESLGKTAAGCVRTLEFSNDINIVLSGSVWVKGNYINMLQAFKDTLIKYCPNGRFSFSTLKQPPALGAVVWALEEAGRPGAAKKVRELSF